MQRKTRLASKWLIAFLALAGVLCVFSRVPSRAFCEGTAGIGISDYELNANVTVGQSHTFEIARVSNVGTLDYTVTAKWNPNYSSGSLTVKVSPETVHLKSDESVIVKAEVVDPSAVGTYSGTVEFETQVANTGNGNPSSPSGLAHATFNVKSTSETNLTFGFPLPLVVVAAVIAVAVVAALAYWRLRKKK